MIYDKEAIYERIRNYKFNLKSYWSNYQEGLNELEKAVSESISIGTCLPITEELAQHSKTPEFHIALSGGIDSSTALMKILQTAPNHSKIVAHTIATREDHPDVIYSKELAEKVKKSYKNFNHDVHILKVEADDIKDVQKVFGIQDPSQHITTYMLVKTLSKHANKIILCDTIDEQLCGYYPHSHPWRMSKKWGDFYKYHCSEDLFEEGLTMDENRIKIAQYFMSRLIPDHLDVIEAVTDRFGVKAFLPYTDKRVMNATNKFSVNERVDENHRKIPMCQISQKSGVPSSIIERRKFGLCSALD
jgi:asparagine synthetase B (glutamine-hydrolysing)